MTATRRACRGARKALTVGAFAAALATAAPAAASAAPHDAPTMRAAETITCGEVSPDLPNVFGRDCDTGRWGPVSDVTIVDRNSQAAYHCQNGWAEGSLWVQGQACRRA
ncbi:hypothetical protein [Streptosporangium sp. KLBMP 9127]|nr:hypothetical protein [Streptosporangium sp. KLBMP 9127]